MLGKGRKDFTLVWKDLPQVWEGSGGPPTGPGGVEKTSRRSRRDREDLLQVREGLGGPHEGPGGTGKTSRRPRRGREDLTRFGRGHEDHQQVWECMGGPLQVREGPGGPPAGLKGVRRISRRSKMG